MTIVDGVDSVASGNIEAVPCVKMVDVASGNGKFDIIIVLVSVAVVVVVALVVNIVDMVVDEVVRFNRILDFAVVVIVGAMVFVVIVLAVSTIERGVSILSRKVFRSNGCIC